MYVRFWGTRGSIPTPGRGTAGYGGNTSCVELRTSDDTLIVLDCGTGIRELGLELAQSAVAPRQIHLLISHTHWDHIQGFPFFLPASIPEMELHIYAPFGFQRGLQDSLSGQMQYSYFPVNLNDLSSRIHYTELEEGFFRIGDVLVETQYLNHTAPTIAYRISIDGATVAYATDHEPYWDSADGSFQHPGDQRHIDFLRGADLLIHDSQYTCQEYADKHGWGHSTIEYATDVAISAGVSRLALFHHDPSHDDVTVKELEALARRRAAATGSSLEIFAASEGMGLNLKGHGSPGTIARSSALDRRWISGHRVMIVSEDEMTVQAINQVLVEDGLVLTSSRNGHNALTQAARLAPDLVILTAEPTDLTATDFITPLRQMLARPDLPVLLLTSLENIEHAVRHDVVTDYLAYPFSPPMLRTRVRAWLARTAPNAGALEHSKTDQRNEKALLSANYAAVLRAMPMFRTLNGEQLDRLASHSVEEVFPSGHVVIRQGEMGTSVYIVLSGRVRIVTTPPDTSVELFLGELGPLEVFGELGILRELPRSASVITMENTSCMVLPEPDFVAALRASPEAAIELMKIMAARLYDADRLLARHAPDPLTGLLGHRAFNELYRRVAGAARRKNVGIVLLVLDIVHLKQINDTFGYSMGDTVLRTVADALLEASRNTDLIARYGSDQFCALLVDADATHVDLIVDRVRQRLRESAVNRGLPLVVECSIGFAVTQNPPEAVDELLCAADRDMQSKRHPAVSSRSES